MNDSQSTVVTSFAVVGLSVYLGSLASGNRPSVRPVAGIAVAGAVLIAAAGAPRTERIARQFAVLIAVTAALTSGFYAARAVGRFFGGSLTSQPTYEPGRMRD